MRFAQVGFENVHNRFYIQFFLNAMYILQTAIAKRLTLQNTYCEKTFTGYHLSNLTYFWAQ